MSSNEDGGPAFPNHFTDGDRNLDAVGGLTVRQYAAIHLRVPDSGIDWLDEMIREANGNGYNVGGAMRIGMPMQGSNETGWRTLTYIWPDGYAETETPPDYLDGQWHDWHGGECPVNGDPATEVEMRDGRILRAQANDFHWTHCGAADDTVRFRVVKP